MVGLNPQPSKRPSQRLICKSCSFSTLHRSIDLYLHLAVLVGAEDTKLVEEFVQSNPKYQSLHRMASSGDRVSRITEIGWTT
jgi:hypothetical protein